MTDLTDAEIAALLTESDRLRHEVAMLWEIIHAWGEWTDRLADAIEVSARAHVELGRRLRPIEAMTEKLAEVHR